MTAQAASDALMATVYDELRRLARSYLRRERPDHTLEATALVHEAYLRLADHSRVEWRGRSHFFAVGAETMRRLLVDHARRRTRLKRGAAGQRVTLHEGLDAAGDGEVALADVLALDAALHRLAALDARQARAVELRFFAGMTVDEIAAELAVSPRTVAGDLAHARVWLRRALADETTGAAS